MSFAQVFTNSGLSGPELGVIYGVSRQTIYMWRDGHTPHEKQPHSRGSILYPPQRFARITNALLVSIDKQLLPMGAMGKAARKERVAKMAAKLQGSKPAPQQ